MKATIFIICLLFSTNLFGWEISSPKTKVQLLELYSSEGCSSCPPAEKWLTTLKSHPLLWKSFVPVEFHVDYWNRLGWTDPFSSKEYTARQRRYARQWGSGSVYTPAFILGGKEWRRNKRDLKPSKKNVGVLKVKSVGQSQYQISFSSTEKGPFYATTALLGNGFSIKVNKGENSGKVLKHEFVVMHLRKTLLKRSGSTFIAESTLKPQATVIPKSKSIAVWITNKKGIPIQAIGRDI